MNRLRVLAAIAFALAAGCATLQPPASARATGFLSTMPPATPTPPHARPIWRYTLPASWDQFAIRGGKNTIVAGGRTSSFALDETTGKALWRINGAISTIALGRSLAYGTPDGAIVQRALRTGTLLWRARHVCKIAPPPYGPMDGPVGTIVRFRNDILVGCDGGTVVRIDASSGKIRRRAFVLPVQHIDKIQSLGSCAFGVSGWADGATLVERMAIVNCRDLRTIVPTQDDTQVLGTVGKSAILDDTCCFGRPNVYRPATIIRASLRNGTLSPKIDLTPEPQLYPAERRPIGQNAVAFLVENDLYLAVDHALYYYGDERKLLGTPVRVQGSFVQPPVVVGNGTIAAHLFTGDGKTFEEIARVERGSLHPTWRTADTLGAVIGTLPNVSGAVAMGYGVVRVNKPVQLHLPPSCQLTASDDSIAVAICSGTRLAGNQQGRYLAGFRWPAATATSRHHAGL